MITTRIISATVFAAALAAPALADTDASGKTMTTGLIIPEMNAALGRELFASKGCVVCHSIQGIGGFDAPPLDAEYMDSPMNPFDFAARMWRGAETMVEMQRDELGYVIELDGEELASIIAFVHDGDQQMKFSETDFPEEIRELLSEME